MLGDNKENHQIGGFVENFSKYTYFRRTCEVNRLQFNENFFCKRELRNVENYNKCLLQLQVHKTDNVKGIKLNSTLNKLNYYHVAKFGLAPCAGHDCDEGFIKKDLFFILESLIKEDWFTEGLLNYRINDIKLLSQNSVFVSNVSLKSNKKKLEGTASQIRRLLLLIPIAVAEKVKDFENDVREMLLCLRLIMSLVYAPALSNRQIALSKLEIDRYFILRKKCFPNENSIPKHEYLKHYPLWLRQLGPLKHIWTLRCEAQHSERKQVIRDLINFQKGYTKSFFKEPINL